jgi:cysteine synthase
MTQFRIVDSTAPLNRRWVVNRSTQMASNSYRDYAIVARFTDSDTGKVEVIVAGIGAGGTTAAAMFLTDSGNLAQVQRAAQAAGDKKNMELVLSTQIVNGESGSPKIEADYFW